MLQEPLLYLVFIFLSQDILGSSAHLALVLACMVMVLANLSMVTAASLGDCRLSRVVLDTVWLSGTPVYPHIYHYSSQLPYLACYHVCWQIYPIQGTVQLEGVEE